MTEKTSDRYPQVSFRSGALLPALQSRASRESISDIAKRDLERYYALLDRSTPTFTESEASLIVDAHNGTLTEPHTAKFIWAVVADAIEFNGFDAKWGVDGPALLARLRAFSLTESLAVADAAERFWAVAEDRDRGEVLREVGLVT